MVPDKVAQAVDSFVKSPTPENMAELEKLSPDIFAAARALVVSGGSDGK